MNYTIKNEKTKKKIKKFTLPSVKWNTRKMPSFVTGPSNGTSAATCLTGLPSIFLRVCLGLSLPSTNLVLSRMMSSHLSCSSPLARITKQI
jgi:hypothetical protein